MTPSRPARPIASATNLIVEGTVDVSSQRGIQTGAGANYGACPAGTLPQDDYGGAGGGAGGSFGGSGSAIGAIFGAFVLRSVSDLLFVFDIELLETRTNPTVAPADVPAPGALTICSGFGIMIGFATKGDALASTIRRAWHSTLSVISMSPMRTPAGSSDSVRPRLRHWTPCRSSRARRR